MKLESPLSSLVARCQTICVPECCGIGAYDFSPIHIASHLIMWRGEPDIQEVAILKEQLSSLKTNYGSRAANGGGVEITEMNQGFTGHDIDELVEKILANLEGALELIRVSQQRQAG